MLTEIGIASTSQRRPNKVINVKLINSRGKTAERLQAFLQARIEFC